VQELRPVFIFTVNKRVRIINKIINMQVVVQNTGENFIKKKSIILCSLKFIIRTAQWAAEITKIQLYNNNNNLNSRIL
jgi:hypothetical protein